MTMQILILGFPFQKVWKYTHNRRKSSTTPASHDSATECGVSRRGNSALTDTTGSSNRMWLKSDLDKLLATNAIPLQVFASCVEINGENMIFLTKVAEFETTFAAKTMTIGSNPTIQAYVTLRKAMFHVALKIYVSLFYVETAAYPTNVESNIYAILDKLFGPAAKLAAATRLPARLVGSYVPNVLMRGCRNSGIPGPLDPASYVFSCQASSLAILQISNPSPPTNARFSHPSLGPGSSLKLLHIQIRPLLAMFLQRWALLPYLSAPADTLQPRKYCLPRQR